MKTSPDRRITDRLDRLLASTGDPSDFEQALAQIVTGADALFAPDLCVLQALNPFTGQLRQPPLWKRGAPDHEPPCPALDSADPLIRAALSQPSPPLVYLDSASLEASGFAARERLRALVALRLLARDSAPSTPDRPLALLLLGYRAPTPFEQHARGQLETFAARASAHLRQCWPLYRRAEVARIGTAINQDLSTVAELFQTLQHQTGALIDSSHLLLLAAYQRARNELDLHLVEDGQPRELAGQPLAGMCRRVLDEGQPVLIRERSQSPLSEHLALIPGSAPGEEALLFVPLQVRGLALGVLSVQSAQPNAYDEEDLRIMRLLGNHVALALSNIRLYEGLEQVTHTGQLLQEEFDREILVQKLARRIHRASGADLVLIYPYDGHQVQLPPDRSGDLLVPDHPLDMSSHSDHMANLILRHGKPVFAHDSARLYNLLGVDPERRHGNFEQREQVRSTAAVPLQAGTNLLGVLFVNFRQSQRFDKPQRLLITSLASYAAAALLASWRLDLQRGKRLKELEILRQIDDELGQLRELRETLQIILNLALEYTGAEKGAIYLYEEHRRAPALEERNRVLAPKAAMFRGSEHQQNLFLPISQERGLIWYAFKQGRIINAANVRAAPWDAYYIAETPDIRSELDTPLIDGQRAVGVINLESCQLNAFSQEHEQFLGVLAGRAVLAIQSAQAYERARRLEDERQALIDIASDLVQRRDSDQVFERIMDKALEITRAPHGTLMLYNAQTQMLTLKTGRGVLPGNESHSIHSGIVGLAARERCLVNVGDVELPEWSDIHLGFIAGVRSEMAVPILDGERLYGVLNVESPQPYQFTERDEGLLVALADLGLIALHNAEQYQQLQERERQLRALHEIDERLIGQSGDPEQVITTVLDQALQLTGATCGEMYIVHSGVVTSIYEAERAPGGERIGHCCTTPEQPSHGSEAQGIVAHVARTGKPYLTAGDAQLDPFYQGGPHTHSEVAVPLFARSSLLIGVLNLESRTYECFSETTTEILQLLASQAVIAIQNAQLHERLKLFDQAGRELAAIERASEDKRAYRVVREIVRRTQPDSQVTTRRYNLLNGELRVVDRVPDHPIQPPECFYLNDGGVNGTVALIRQTIVVPDVDDPPEGVRVLHQPTATGSLICTPIQLGAGPAALYYGNLTVTMIAKNQVLEIDRALLEGLAQHLALTLRRLELTEAHLEAEKRANENEAVTTIGQAAFELAHRLGNDLGLITPTVNSIRRELDRLGVQSEKLTRDLNRIVSDKERATGMISSLKDNTAQLTSSLDRARAARRLRVAHLLGQVLRDIQPRLSAVALVAEPVQEELTLLGDEREVSDILHNLLTNASEAMDHRGTIWLRARPEGAQVVIEVADSGPGIDPQHRARIFDLLFSTKRSSGFGLWSAKRNAQANGGDLRLLDGPGPGTTFQLLLPRADTAPPSAG